ncbi:hypothetical protein VHEMI02549 [[Torrubiella] hemipterigena]|uniref:Transcriptional coactivator p15 (PC4) C-terminal domain-containing protein n=1 Tax=[Torrubiella] hemipterigena TaxID=1531966 RepID=A0A0A1TAU1_9HYPO|nr:hypothetical protein VHEMI02549 [[Torrubiella] hemipterigena]
MTEHSKKRRASTEDDSDGGVPHKTSKKTKNVAAAAAPAGKDDEGNPFWDLSNKRRVGVSQFKNMCLINIREYYEKDGKLLPGKKGISLSLEQYTTLVRAIPGINAHLRSLGQLANTSDDVDDDDAAASKPSRKAKTKAEKANIDATSDEEEDDD